METLIRKKWVKYEGTLVKFLATQRPNNCLNSVVKTFKNVEGRCSSAFIVDL